MSQRSVNCWQGAGVSRWYDRVGIRFLGSLLGCWAWLLPCGMSKSCYQQSTMDSSWSFISLTIEMSIALQVTHPTIFLHCNLNPNKTSHIDLQCSFSYLNLQLNQSLKQKPTKHSSDTLINISRDQIAISYCENLGCSRHDCDFCLLAARNFFSFQSNVAVFLFSIRSSFREYQ